METTHSEEDFQSPTNPINNSTSSFTSYSTNTITMLEDVDDPINNYEDRLKEDEIEFFSNLPNGYHFCPNDVELVLFLRRKVYNEPLSFNRIIEVDIYRHNPQTLAAKYAIFEEFGKFYFFTPRNKKYKNGKRPNRAARNGFWKATGADKLITSNDEVIGKRKALVFYMGTPTQKEKTTWIMHEFRVLDPPKVIKKNEADMKLDDWVLCRIYKRVESKSKKNKSKSLVEENETNTTEKIENNGQLMMMERSPSVNSERLEKMEASTSMGMLQSNFADVTDVLLPPCLSEDQDIIINGLHETNAQPLHQFQSVFHHPDSSINGNYQGMMHQSFMYQHTENNNVLNSGNVVQDSNLVIGDMDAHRIMILPTENGCFESINFQHQLQQELLQELQRRRQHLQLQELQMQQQLQELQWQPQLQQQEFQWQQQPELQLPQQQQQLQQQQPQLQLQSQLPQQQQQLQQQQPQLQLQSQLPQQQQQLQQQQSVQPNLLHHPNPTQYSM